MLKGENEDRKLSTYFLMGRVYVMFILVNGSDFIIMFSLFRLGRRPCLSRLCLVQYGSKNNVRVSLFIVQSDRIMIRVKGL